MRAYRHNKTKLTVLAVLVILWGLTHAGNVSSGTYADSAHGDTTSGVNRPGTECPPGTPCPTGDCTHCHDTFASSICGVNDIMLFADKEALCEECHDADGPASTDIKSALNKTYHHPTHDYSGRHTLSSLEWGQDGAPFSGANRHAECADCHNPHTIGGIEPDTPKIHPTGLSSPIRGSNGNTIYNTSIGTACLQGVWGVEPTWPGSSWASPTGYTETLPSSNPPYPRYAEKEYQICFKCHSSYASESVDIAKEFSPLNKSGHPVMVTQNNRTGSDPPKALASNAVGSSGQPWNSGESTMYCSDCHGSHLTTGAGGSQGVHGSDTPAGETMLRGWRANYMSCWPTDYLGNYWTLKMVKDNTAPSWKTYLFCYNCHPIYLSGAHQWGNNVHSEHAGHYVWSDGEGNLVKSTDAGAVSGQIRCIHCHVRRVHGSQLGRLIGDQQITVFTKIASPNNYGPTGCSVSFGCSGWATSSPHAYP